MSAPAMHRALGLSLLLLGTVGCASTTARPPAAGTDAVRPQALPDAANALLAGLARRCGQAYAGVVEIDVPETADSTFSGKPLVMHVRECGRDAARVPFHVGDDHSRTWVFTRTPAGLRLKHDHRHADGSPDALTMYGGDAGRASAPDAPVLRIEFPVDAESVAMFKAQGREVSVTNTWAVELSGNRYVYELSRPGGRLFRVVFDLDRPVPAPPPPWGAGEAAP
jgi:hypothetical protein